LFLLLLLLLSKSEEEMWEPNGESMEKRDVEGGYYFYYGESQLPGVSAMPWPARDGDGDCEDDDDDGD